MERRLQQFVYPKVLIIDEMGYLPMTGMTSQWLKGQVLLSAKELWVNIRYPATRLNILFHLIMTSTNHGTKLNTNTKIL